MKSACIVATTVASAANRMNRNFSSCSSAVERSKIVIEKISARVFCPLPSLPQSTTVTGNNVALIDDGVHKSPKSGGNPVTIFKILSSAASPSSQQISSTTTTWLSPEERSKLASSCQWESVFIFPPTNANANDTATAMNSEETFMTETNNKNSVTTATTTTTPMAFYLPTGQPVSFCAHAAMGGAYAYFHSNSSSGTERIQLNLMDTKKNPDAQGATTTSNPEPNTPVPNDETTPTTYVATYHRDIDDNTTSGSIALEVQNIVWQQEPIEHPTTLHRILREYHKVNGSTDCTLPMIEVLPTQEQWKEQNLDQYEPQILKSKYNKVIPLPTFVNSWVGDRKKTLVYINKDHTLHTRILPPPSRAAEKHYPAACDSLQNTTGLYLFATKTTKKDQSADQREIKLDYPVLDPNNADENVWECRQFPRQSGYAEDPATGVAAAALAISLRFCEIETLRMVGYGNHNEDVTTKSEDRNTMTSPAPSSKYEFYQGTAMQQPSYIVVENIQVHSLVTQEEEEQRQHPSPSSTTQDELSVFKYAKTVDEEVRHNDKNNNNNSPANVMAERINNMAQKNTKDIIDDDAALEKEAANVDLFNNVDDDEIWEEDDDEEEEDDDHASSSSSNDTVPPTLPPPIPKKDYRYHHHRGIVSFTLSGRIEIDAIERIELE